MIGLDQFVGTLFGIPADITISAYVGYKYSGGRVERLINWIMDDPEHCMKSFMSDYGNIVKYYGATNG